MFCHSPPRTRETRTNALGLSIRAGIDLTVSLLRSNSTLATARLCVPLSRYLRCWTWTSRSCQSGRCITPRLHRNFLRILFRTCPLGQEMPYSLHGVFSEGPGGPWVSLPGEAIEKRGERKSSAEARDADHSTVQRWRA